MNRRFLPYLLSLSFAVSSLSVSGQALKPGWHCLPSETAVALRIPDGEGFYAAMQGTVIGRHLFGEERVEALLELARSEGGDDWEAFQEELGALGLSVADLPSLLRGESGAALLLSPGSDGNPESPDRFVLFWATPGEDLGERAMEALLRSVEERETEHPTVRVDFSLEGQGIVHLASPQVVRVFGGDGDSVVTHNAHTLLTRRDSRIIGIITLESGPDRELVWRIREGESVELPDPDPEPGETMVELLARFLRAHEGENGEFFRELRAAPGLREALPPGIPAFESAVNPERLFGLRAGNDDIVQRFLEASGVSDLGRTAFRAALDGNVFRWGGFVSAPSPRRGIVETLLDQRELEPRPPAWVPANAVDYTQASLDLGRLYSRIREIVVGVMGEEAESAFAQAEMQVRSMTQADIASTLSSLGDHHSFVMLPTDRTGGPLAESFADNLFSDRMAAVWAVRNEDVWQRIMQTIAMFAPMAGGAVRPAEEQGFAGWRVENETFEGGLFLGRGFLTLGAGRGTMEEILAALRSPPEGANALADGELYRDAETFLNLRPGLYWELQDLGRQMEDIALTLEEMLRLASREDPDAFPDGVTTFLESILDPGVFREAYGVGVNQVFATGDGLVMESAQELTPVPN